jgi:hypothetical protein
VPALLHQGATVVCAHQGRAQPAATDPKVSVTGQAVVTQPTSYSIAGCTLPPPPGANGPCATGQWLSASTKIQASGVPVLLASSASICAPTGTPMQVQVTQQKVQGV